MLTETQREILEYVMSVPVRVKLYTKDEIKPRKGFIRSIDYVNGVIRYSGHLRGIEHVLEIDNLYFVDYANKENRGQYRLEKLFPDRVNPENFTKEIMNDK